MKSNTAAALFVMWHKSVDRQHFLDSLTGFNGDIIFLKAGSAASDDKGDQGSNLYEGELPNCDLSLQRRGYMAGSMLVNLYRSQIHRKYSHVGFVEYDIRFDFATESSRTVDLLNSCIDSDPDCEVVSFSTQRTMRGLHDQREIQISGENAIDWLHARLVGAHGMPLSKLLDKPAITQQSFFTSSTLFDLAMRGIDQITLDKSFERGYRTWHRPSTLVERAIAVQLAALSSSIAIADATHLSEQNWTDRPSRSNWKRYVSSYFRRR